MTDDRDDPSSPALTEPETPDLETSSESYAQRFAGRAGRYFLDAQENALEKTLADLEFSTVLDVGGGHGQLVPYFLNRGCDITILASSERAHGRVRETFHNADIRYDAGDLLELPYADDSFDVVVAVRLISHIDNHDKLVSEFCRVARKAVVIDYPCWMSLNALTPLLFALKKGIEGNTRTYKSFFRLTVARMFRRHGFELKRACNQFFLPMFVHRALNGARWLQGMEQGCRYLGLTRLFGSPAVVRADRSCG